jgi:hypothetical protein
MAKPELKEFELKERALTEMVKHIQETVSSTYISWTYDCDTVYEMLVALQRRLKPKDDVRRRESLLISSSSFETIPRVVRLTSGYKTTRRHTEMM